MMTKQVIRSRTFLTTVLLLAFGLLLSAGTVHAQDTSSQAAYKEPFENAIATAKEGMKLEQSGNIDGAVKNYEEAYRQMSKVSEMAQEAGSVENANLAKKYAARFAYRAGSLLHNEGRSQDAIPHFEFGQQVAPASYTRNATGLKAAQAALKQGPIVDASRALREGNAQKALDLLSEVEEQTATSYFYQAIAHQDLGNAESALGYAQQALEAGGLDASRQGQMHLLIGEQLMKQGDTEAAREALTQAADVGGPQVSDRAQALIEQL